MAADPQIVSGITEKVLTHEVGAGAPCLKCGDKCPGLDLHFWRKICRNCKCKQEDHDVLSSISTRGINNIGKLLMQDREIAQQKPPKSNESSPPPKAPKAAAPPPAPKPVKQTIVNDTNSNVNGTAKSGDLNVTIDIGGKKHSLDFGGHAEQNDMPPPPNFDDQGSFPAPPPPIDNDKLPEVPPLPQEFNEKVEIKEEKPAVIEEYQQTELKPEESLKSQESRLTPTMPPSSSDDEEKEYEWTPPVADQKLVTEYIEALPKDKQPVVGTAGAKYRKKQLMRQLPPHDQEPGECHDLTDQETQEMNLFVKQYRKKALGGGKVEENSKVKSCAECIQPLKVGDVIVWAERAGSEKYWHPGCFVCAECKELLVDLIYFYHEDKIYCGRHYCELHKPRCAACDELIFAPEYTQAEDCYWHLKHFCCWHCDQPLGGKNYVPHDNQPVCIPCYEKSFAHSCSTCKEIIAPNTEWVTFEEFHWHAQPECFKCTECSKSLVGKPCIPKGEMVFCCSQCKRAKIPPGQ
uniref:Testin n=1 Tax=Phallusia mammillata TaxID=59560 RepID=A0A6F9DFL2_9ASCI|nr:testin [Phallusia mammillata]